MTAMYIPSDVRMLTFEKESTFGSDPSPSSQATKTKIRAIDAQFVPDKNWINPQLMKLDSIPRGPDAYVAGGLGGKLTFKIPMRGSGGIGVSNDINAANFTRLAQFCGMTVTQKSRIANAVTGAGSGSNQIAVADANAGYLGHGLGCILEQGSVGQMRFVLTKTSNAGTTTSAVNANWSSAPVAQDELSACDTMIPFIGQSTMSATFYLYEGAGTTDKSLYICSGCNGTFKFDTTKAGEIPHVSFDFNVDRWTHTAAHDLVTQGSDAFAAAHPLLNDPFYFGGTRTLTESFGFDPGLKIAPINSTYGTHGREGWVYTTPEPKIDIAPLFDPAHVTLFSSGTASDVMFTSVKDPDECWGVWVRKAQVIKYESVNGGFGHRQSKIDFAVIDPGVSSDTAAAQYPMFAIAVSGYTAP